MIVKSGAYRDLICENMMTEDVTFYHPSLSSFGNVTDALRKYRISVVCAAVMSKETYKSLYARSVVRSLDGDWCTVGARLTEKAGILMILVV